MQAALGDATEKLLWLISIPVETYAGRFKCTRCGSRKTEARPERPNEGGRVKKAWDFAFKSAGRCVLNFEEATTEHRPAAP